LRNIALRIAYDGTDFIGSQLQQMGRSIQGALEDSWERLTQERRRFTLAGRTDTGVHAQGQVANVRSETAHPLKTLLRGMNAILPDDVAVLEVCEVGLDFHARHSATRRSYRYLIDNNPVALPVLRHTALHIDQVLNIGLMAEALKTLEGQHDFAAFSAQSSDEKSTVRRMYYANCGTVMLYGRQVVAVDLEANAFLHHMVRSIVGTVLLVGREKMTVEAFAQVLKRRERSATGKTAGAHGLTLMEVHYPPNLVQWANSSN
jgi:tRNA pseudouridine38-40 synthase